MALIRKYLLADQNLFRLIIFISLRADEDFVDPSNKRSASTATMPLNRPNGRGGGGVCPGHLFGDG
jgi:hypothetical protein